MIRIPRWKHLDEADERRTDVADLYLSTFQALALAVDAKYHLTDGHVRRVQRNAVTLAGEVGIADPGLLKAIDAAALLHDLGKLGIPDYLLNKPGPLTAREFEQVKRHVVIGADILSALPFPYPLVPIVRHHHENWDGTGYPDALQGASIPIGARVLAVVDCYDALTSNRPYRRALPRERAVAMIRERCGTMYDPAVVAAFLRIHPHLQSGAPTTVVAVILGWANEAPASTGQTSESTGETFGEALPARVDARHPGVAALDDEHAIAIARQLLADTPADLVVWYRHNAAIGQLVAHDAVGLGAEVVRSRVLPTGTGISGWVAVTKTAVRNSDPALDFYAQGIDAAPFAAGSALAIAGNTAGAVSDVVTLYAKGCDRFTEADAQLAYRLLRSATDWRGATTDSAAGPLDSAQGGPLDMPRPRPFTQPQTGASFDKAQHRQRIVWEVPAV